MRTKKILSLLMAVCLFTACNKEEILEQNYSESKPVWVKDGYLHFSDQSSFDYMMNELRNSESNENSSSRAASIFNFGDEFVSIYQMNEELKSQEARALDKQIVSDVVMNGDKNDYNLYKTEECLKEEALTHMMDTTMRIHIGNTYYKITPDGTFSGTNEKDVADAARTFNLSTTSKQSIGNYQYTLAKRVIWTDSFGKVSSAIDADNVISNVVVDTNNAKYGLKSYKWKNNSLWQKFWDSIRGKDVTKEHNFNSSLRVQMEIFDVNYGFYESCGIKVKLQKKKKFLFINYWKETTADDIVIGVEEMMGEMNFNYNPTKLNYLDVFETQITGLVYPYLEFIYNGLAYVPILSNWIDKKLFTVYTGMGIHDRVRDYLKYPYTFKLVKNPNPSDPQAKVVFREVYAGLRNLVGKPLRDLGRKVMADEPKVGLHFPESGKMQTYIVDGIQSYGKKKSKTVRFSQSGGITFYMGVIPIGYLPENFNLKDFSIFGACKVNNVWKGVRFTND